MRRTDSRLAPCEPAPPSMIFHLHRPSDRIQPREHGLGSAISVPDAVNAQPCFLQHFFSSGGC
jgi:hypothetical protein